MTYYHVDTTDSLEENFRLKLNVHPPESGSYQFAGAASAFEEGFSPWGGGKIWANIRDDDTRLDLVIKDWIFELYRRENDIEAPSRFQSLFVCETVEEAEAFFEEYKPKAETGEIYEVEAEEVAGPYYFNWYDGSTTPGEIYWKAQQYWNGRLFVTEDGEGPTEYLVDVPCEIGDKVANVEKEIEEDDESDEGEHVTVHEEDVGGEWVPVEDSDDHVSYSEE